MTLNIAEGGNVPAVTQNRTKEPNPFDGLFPTKGHGTDNQLTLVVELPSGTEEADKYVNKVAAQAQAAARNSVSEDAPHGYTARIKREAFEQGTGKNRKQMTRLIIWSTDRVFRTRKPKETAAE